jgi:hypothetical protein
MAVTVAAPAWAQGDAITTTHHASRGADGSPDMTASFTRKIFQAVMVLAFAVSMSVLSVQPSFAFSAEAQQMCTGDAFRLCSSDIPNIPAITACMVKHRTELSSGCRAVMDRNLAAKGKVAAAN